MGKPGNLTPPVLKPARPCPMKDGRCAMQITLESTYRITVTRQELRLIGLALAGLLPDGSSEREAALRLNAKLMEGVRSVVAEYAETVAGAEAKAAVMVVPLPRLEGEGG